MFKFLKIYTGFSQGFQVLFQLFFECLSHILSFKKKSLNMISFCEMESISTLNLSKENLKRILQELIKTNFRETGCSRQCKTPSNHSSHTTLSLLLPSPFSLAFKTKPVLGICRLVKLVNKSRFFFFNKQV